MFYRLLFLAGIYFLALCSYAQSKDDFEHGHLDRWTGKPGDFIINSMGELQLQASGAGQSYLVTQNRLFADSVIWEFRVRMDFNPSGSNLARVYLASDSDDLSGSLNGFFVQIGDTDDEISLFRQQGSTIEKIIDGQDDLVDLSAVDVRIRVVRTVSGLWSVYQDVGASGVWSDGGVATDTLLVESSFFGFWCDYTSTRADKFFFDDLLIKGRVAVNSFKVLSNDSLFVEFNQPVIPISTSEVTIYRATNSQLVDSVSVSDNQLMISLQEALSSGSYELQLKNITDHLTGSFKTDTSISFSYQQLGLVAVDELADTVTQLIFNDAFDGNSAGQRGTFTVTGREVNRVDWNANDGSRAVKLTVSPPFIDGEAYEVAISGLLNRESNSMLDTVVIKVFKSPLLLSELLVMSHRSLKLRFSKSLNPDSVQLEDFEINNGNEVTAVELQNDSTVILTLKQELNSGEVEVRMQNLESIDGAAVPSGYRRSVKYDRLRLVRVNSDNQKGLRLHFNQSVKDDWNLSQRRFEIEELGNPVRVESKGDSTIWIDFERTSNAVYQLGIDSLVNASGNSYLVEITIEVRWNKPINRQDVVFSEIMADPTPPMGLPEVEYVEVYNRTDLPLILENYLLNDEPLPTIQLAAGEYLALHDVAVDSGRLGNSLLIDKLDALSNEGESLVLQDTAGHILDSLSYSLDWYDDIEKDDGGYSLELLDVDFLCHDDYSWTASISSNGGTPGAVNSVRRELRPDSAELTVFVKIQGDSMVLLDFNIPAELKTASIQGHQTLGISKLGQSKYEILLESGLASEQWYTLTLDSLNFCNHGGIFRYQKQFYFDNTGPRLIKFYPISTSELALIFQEPLKESTAQDEANYLINGLQPARAIRQDSASNRVHIQLQEQLAPGDSIELQLLAMEDTLSNSSRNYIEQILLIDYLASADFLAADIVVVEFSGQPTPSVALDPGRYLLDGIGRPIEVVVDPANSRIYKLRFDEPVRENRKYSLYVDGMISTEGALLPSMACEIVFDTRPPGVDSVGFANDSTMTILFDEAISIAEAVNPLHYRWDERIPIEVVPTAIDRINIVFGESFLQEIEIFIEILFAKDLAGNSLKRPIVVSAVYDTRPPNLVEAIQVDEGKIRLRFNEQILEDSIAGVASVEVASFHTLPYDQSLLEISFVSTIPEIENFDLKLIGIGDRYGNTADTISASIDTRLLYVKESYFRSSDKAQIHFSKKVNESSIVLGEVSGVDAVLSPDGQTVELRLRQPLRSGDSLFLDLQEIRTISGFKAGNPMLNLVYQDPLEHLTVLDTALLEARFRSQLSTVDISNFVMPSKALLVAHSPEDAVVRLLSSKKFPSDSLLEFSWTNLSDRYGRPLPDGRRNFFIDTRGPVVQSIVGLLGNQVILVWSEPVAVDRLSPKNFEVEGRKIVDLQQPDEMHSLLTLDKLEIEDVYHLQYRSVFDSMDNFTAWDSISFRYSPPRLPERAEVIINEIMADPTPSRGLPEEEYLELLNVSGYEVDLSSLFLSDATTTTQLPSFKLQPSAFVILGGNPNSAYFDSGIDYVYVPGFPSLNNGGETLILATLPGSVVDSVTYHPSMYQEGFSDGYALERINPDPVCNPASNWSSHEEGGSPGKANVLLSYEADSVSPEIIGLVWMSDSELNVLFGEKMDTSIVGELRMVNAEITFINEKEVSIKLIEPLTEGQLYQFTLEGFADCSGNIMDYYSFEHGVGKKPGPLDLLITEIMSDPNPAIDLPEDEYVELYNATKYLLSLDGILLKDESGNAVALRGLINPGEFMAFSNQSNSQNNLIAWQGSLSLSNEGELLYLQSAADDDNELIFWINYDKDWHSIETDGGRSLELYDLSDPCKPNSWGTSRTLAGGTPGVANSTENIRSEDRQVFIANASTRGLTEIALEFSEPISSPVKIDFLVNDQQVSQVDWELLEKPVAYLQLQDSLNANDNYMITVRELENCQGVVVEQDSIEVIAPSRDFEQIVISEIHFDPQTGGAEFVEIHNLSPNYYDLANLTIKRDEQVFALSESQKLMQPGEYLALSEDAIAILNTYPEANVLQVSNLPALPNDEASLRLYAENLLLDSVFYSDEFHSGLLNDTRGVSLERLDMFTAAISSDNWASAASSARYATPGLPNSQYLMERRTKRILEINPKVFVPGSTQPAFNSLTSIKYKTGYSDLIGSVTIYNTGGQLIKELLNNQPLASEGFVPWDGSDDGGNLVPFGRYIVVFRAFGSQGIFLEERSTVVVGWNF